MSGFFCKSNSLNPLRFSQARETDTKKLSSFAKIQFLNDITLISKEKIPFATWQFGKIEVLKNLFCLSVSLAKENLRGLRELFLQKNPAHVVIKCSLSRN